ncbi:polyphosphate kinase 1 [Phormidium tenue FACHB-886]|nr:polyphosphate kinase 1 [Phormidium tenue FACHB-886]
MPKPKKVVPESIQELNLNLPQYYFNQELSWLEFNRRVLRAAIDSRTRLLERLRLMGIFSSNLDEFFMVRVAGLKRQVLAQVNQPSPDGRLPQDQLTVISQTLRPMLAELHQQFQQEVRPQLAAKGIYLLDYADLTAEQRIYLQQYFDEKIYPVLTPMAVDQSHPFPHIANLSLNLAVTLENTATGKTQFAGLRLPQGSPRFVQFPKELWVQQSGRTTNWVGLPLEQAIAQNLDALFPGMIILNCSLFRVTRNSDLELEEEDADDLLLAIEQELRKRQRGGVAVRLEVQADMPLHTQNALMRELELTEADVYSIDGLMSLNDLSALASLPLAHLKDEPWVAATPPALRQVKGLHSSLSAVNGAKAIGSEDIFAAIRRQDLLVHHPYQSFSSSVHLFITQAANDPDVLAIKMTLYRTAGNSPIVQALVAAAENGKQVAVLIELKALFDEETNIHWARKLESAGVHVVYGLMGLKTHTKVTLVVRREGTTPQDSHIRRYVHISTGNYNHRTARTYTDLSLFSGREELGVDLSNLFNSLTGYSRQQAYHKLLVAPVNLRKRLLDLIQREIHHCRKKRHGRIVLKMNALVDPAMIRALYEASQAGVKIDLIVRGICCLRPGLVGISDNIRVISVMGRFLEHSRIFYFHNNGDSEIFIGSADWMPRNLDRRVEVVVPIEDPVLAKELEAVLSILLTDNRHTWELQPDGQYVQRRCHSAADEQDAQAVFMKMASQEMGVGGLKT